MCSSTNVAASGRPPRLGQGVGAAPGVLHYRLEGATVRPGNAQFGRVDQAGDGPAARVGRSHHAFLVDESDRPYRVAEPGTAVVKGGQHLPRRDHSVRSVQGPSFRDGVQVAAGDEGRQRGFGAGPLRDDVADRINPRVGARLRRPFEQPVGGLPPLGRPGQPGDRRRGRGADPGHRAQAGQQPAGIDLRAHHSGRPRTAPTRRLAARNRW